jgi:hypothetical protein
MPITPEKKQQLVEILTDLSGVDRVRIAGTVYDSIIAADLPWADLNAIMMCIVKKIGWNLLPAENFGKIQIMFVRSIDETLLKSIPQLIDKSNEVKQTLSDIFKDINGIELVRIAVAAYAGLVAADILPNKLGTEAIVSKYIFAKVPWKDLPVAFGNMQVSIVKGVQDKLVNALPDLIDSISDTSVEGTRLQDAVTPDPQPETISAGTVTSQSTISFQITPVTTAPITPTTRSPIDDLDEEASMHGMDTESPPENGEQLAEEVKTQSADDIEEENAVVEEEVGNDIDDEDDVPIAAAGDPDHAEDDIPESEASTSVSKSNGHNTDTVVPPQKDIHEPKTTVTTP